MLHAAYSAHFQCSYSSLIRLIDGFNNYQDSVTLTILVKGQFTTNLSIVI